MVQLTALWLPILLSAAFVFVVSSLFHMVIPIHKGDCKKMGNEDKVLEAFRAQAVQPGEYMFPCPSSMKEMSSPEMVAKFEKGPVGWLLIRPAGTPGIGKSLIQWFVYCIVLGIFTGYIGTHALAAGANYLKVFQVTGAAAVAMYAFASVPNSIWKGTSWATTFKFIFDGVVYGLVTAGTFGWLWPK